MNSISIFSESIITDLITSLTYDFITNLSKIKNHIEKFEWRYRFLNEFFIIYTPNTLNNQITQDL